ncbi:hypothetical protein [Streptomyces lydicamycinicus]
MLQIDHLSVAPRNCRSLDSPSQSRDREFGDGIQRVEVVRADLPP